MSDFSSFGSGSGGGVLLMFRVHISIYLSLMYSRSKGKKTLVRGSHWLMLHGRQFVAIWMVAEPPWVIVARHAFARVVV